jgi:hypothetical protein
VNVQSLYGFEYYDDLRYVADCTTTASSPLQPQFRHVNPEALQSLVSLLSGLTRPKCVAEY